jgi:2',3'-cyclic-nucleotide 2'-phosphodiesterase / 3'-nucleotidase
VSRQDEVYRSQEPDSAANRDLDLRILATSDLHANILAWDYHSNRPSDQVGLARVATLIRKARAEQPQSLLFDNGDFLHGTELGDYLAETTPVLRSGRPLQAHPMIAAMNALGYDAATLGNHEFGFGLGFLRRSLAATNFPMVCSNLFFKPTRGKPLALPSLMLERSLQDRSGKSHLLRIGVLGFLPPQTMIWEGRYLKSRASVADIVSSARALVPDLRAQGADLIFALSHSGLETELASGETENASSALAAVCGIDAVIAGHTHLVFPTETRKEIAGKPVVMPGFHGSHLGVIDLRLRQTAMGWVVVGFNAEARPISRRSSQTGQVEALVQDDPEIAQLVKQAQDVLLERNEAVLGETPIPLTSYFALATDVAPVRLVARAQADHVAKALAGRGEANLPLLSAAAPFKAGGRGGPENFTAVPRGPLRKRHLGNLYCHPNSICALRVSGRDLALWLERSASLYLRVAQGAKDAPLIDPRFPSFNFDLIDGLTYEIDLSQPARFDSMGVVKHPQAQRICDLRYRGEALQPDQSFALATNSYRAAGGIGFSGATPGNLIYEGSVSNRKVLADFLANGAMPLPEDSMPRWRFKPMADTSVVFDTSPAAVLHLGEVAHLALEPLAMTEAGFRRFRLWLG